MVPYGIEPPGMRDRWGKDFKRDASPVRGKAEACCLKSLLVDFGNQEHKPGRKRHIQVRFEHFPQVNGNLVERQRPVSPIGARGVGPCRHKGVPVDLASQLWR